MQTDHIYMPINKKAHAKRPARGKTFVCTTTMQQWVISIVFLCIFVSISLYLFFSRNPRGSSRQDPKYFRYSEFFVALLFPQFYILYFAVTVS